MGWRDRPYSSAEYDDSRSWRPSVPRARFRLGAGWSPCVAVLLAINVAVSLIDWVVLAPDKISLSVHAGLNWARGVRGLELWRFVTYMFVHANVWHLVANMIGLYMFGPTIERGMSWRRFLMLYFGCGIAGGAAYLTFGWAGGVGTVVGASGAVLGLVVGYAIRYPHERFILFIVPTKARTVAIFFAAITIAAMFVGGKDNVAHSAHLGGMVFAFVWFYLAPRLGKSTLGEPTRIKGAGAWERKLKAEADDQAEVDAILAKVHEKGLAGLSGREKKKLKDATRRQQEQDARRTRGTRDTYM